MKIALSAGQIKHPLTGVGKYLLFLLRQYLELYPNDRYILYRLPGLRSFFYDKTLFPHAPNVHIRTAYPWVQVIRLLRTICLIDELFLFDADVYHGSAPEIPALRKNKKIVFTIHDLIPLVHPELSLRSAVQEWTCFAKKINTIDCAIIADSEHTKQDIVRVLGISSERIVRIPLAPSMETVSPLPFELNEYLSILNSLTGYILSVGNLEPRKNFVRLIQAYNLLRDRGDYDGKLVIAGRGWWQKPIYSAYEESKYTKDIHLLGYIPESVLTALYQKASVLAFVSLYEGFGLPLLDAFSFGIPVVASNTSSLPEIGGNGAAYVEPLSVESIAFGLKLVLHNETLRKDLVAKGLERLKEFSWKITAQKTFDVYTRSSAF